MTTDELMERAVAQLERETAVLMLITKAQERAVMIATIYSGDLLPADPERLIHRLAILDRAILRLWERYERMRRESIATDITKP